MGNKSEFANKRIGQLLGCFTICIICVATFPTLSAQQKMNIPAGEIRYQYKNSEAHGERRLIFADSGRITRSHTIDTIGNKTTTSDLIATYDSMFVLNTKGGLVIAGPQDREAKLAMEQDYLEQRKWIGRESIIGYLCDIYEYRSRSFWVWSEVPLKMVTGENEMIEIATFFNPAFIPMKGDFSPR